MSTRLQPSCPAACPQAEECLIDFIAVSPEARGKGVGALLMAWAQETGARILQEREPEAVAVYGPLMTLWVSVAGGVWECRSGNAGLGRG